MMKVPLLTVIMLVVLTGTGLASRQWPPEPDIPAVIEPHDAHLQYYESIRPLLVRSMAGREMLCGGSLPRER